MGNRPDTGSVFMFLLYPEESENRKKVLSKILSSGIQDVVWSNHYSDDSKPHTHVLLRVPYQTNISALSNRFGIKSRFIQVCGRDKEHKNYKGAMVYLIHADKSSIAQGKTRYTLDDVYGPWKDTVADVISKIPKSEKFTDNDITIILDWIEKQNYVESITLVRWAVNSGLYSVLRRSLSIVRDCVREHNDLYRGYHNQDTSAYEIVDLRKRLEAAERQIAYVKGRSDQAKRKPDVVVDMNLINEMLGRGKNYG